MLHDSVITARVVHDQVTRPHPSATARLIVSAVQFEFPPREAQTALQTFSLLNQRDSTALQTPLSTSRSLSPPSVFVSSLSLTGLAACTSDLRSSVTMGSSYNSTSACEVRRTYGEHLPSSFSGRPAHPSSRGAHTVPNDQPEWIGCSRHPCQSHH